MIFEKKKVLVVGMARSGVAAAQLLRASGAEVTVNDSKTEEELGQQLKPLEGLQVERRFGCGAMELLEGKDCLVISPGIPDSVPFVVRAKEMGIYVIGELELAAQLSRARWSPLPGPTAKQPRFPCWEKSLPTAARSPTWWAISAILSPWRP